MIAPQKNQCVVAWSSSTISIMSPTLHFKISQMRIRTSIETDSFRVKRAIVADDAPVARRRSVLFISLSIRSFHNFLYDTPTVELLLNYMNILYHISYHISQYQINDSFFKITHSGVSKKRKDCLQGGPRSVAAVNARGWGGRDGHPPAEQPEGIDRWGARPSRVSETHRPMRSHMSS